MFSGFTAPVCKCGGPYWDFATAEASSRDLAWQPGDYKRSKTRSCQQDLSCHVLS